MDLVFLVAEGGVVGGVEVLVVGWVVCHFWIVVGDGFESLASRAGVVWVESLPS